MYCISVVFFGLLIMVRSANSVISLASRDLGCLGSCLDIAPRQFNKYQSSYFPFYISQAHKAFSLRSQRDSDRPQEAGLSAPKKPTQSKPAHIGNKSLKGCRINCFVIFVKNFHKFQYILLCDWHVPMCLFLRHSPQSSDSLTPSDFKFACISDQC